MKIPMPGLNLEKDCHAIAAICFLPPGVTPSRKTGKMKVRLSNKSTIILEPLFCSSDTICGLEQLITKRIRNIKTVAKDIFSHK